MTEASTFEQEIAAGERFGFGRNWERFLSVLTPDRINEATASLTSMLGVDSLRGRTFLDVGCGSGLFSLAAMRLQAARVHSLDFDPDSVACATELKRRYFANADHWTIERGDALSELQMGGLGQWDVVYSWGVLHHTGDMWRAFEHIAARPVPGGLLFLAIYNDQGMASKVWTKVKRLYNANPIGRAVVCGVYFPYFILGGLVVDFVQMRNPISRYTEYKRSRGMSRFHDLHDWLGGYPFEVASPEKVFEFFKNRGYVLERLKTCGGRLGCNEFVFRRGR